MDVSPTFSVFADIYNASRAQVAWTTLVADLDTPVSASIKLGTEQNFVSLLESVEGGATRGRYSFISLKPDVVWKCNGQSAEISRDLTGAHTTFAACELQTLDSLRALIAESRIELPTDLPPMAAGLIGYMGYDTIRLIEDIPDNNPDTIGIPEGLFMRPTVMVIFDSIADTMTIVTPVRPNDGTSADDAYADATARLQTIIETLDRPLPHRPVSGASDADDVIEPVSNVGRSGYHAMVDKAKEYVLAGDIFQVVPSQRLRRPFVHPPFSLYRSLRRLNPSPFLFFLNFDGFSIVGSSPEILVRVRDGKVTIRPIAGTRPRGATKDEDEQHARDLLADPKELAEHLMLLDLGRNDVGRVTRTGTVDVTEEMVIEYYSHVMHIVSNVDGELSPDYDAMDALMAGFPAGTVSGAPKVRAMEIIDELESERRSFYGGAIGYIAANGDLDTCIALRTALVKDGELIVQAGGGIVADSDPEAEFQESQNKAMAIIRAADQAGRYGGNG
ncbi:MAG: anthranilate synthase component I [Rhodospirillaceae bacterium]|jgi:anthranilate synthase component I|nr:anthranilate synthase component I [Rhodospirillaceae bacterium]MBT5567225.1 anthranilate synthase component I [Rhodospirillaceae bacterium]MBT6089438.1 anthranilate synthase component I [Rhodospirillaceae bacterium]